MPVTPAVPNLPPGWPDYPVIGGTRYYLQADQTFSGVPGSFTLDFITQGGRIREIARNTDGQWNFDFRAYTASQYAIEKSANLRDWEPVKTITTGAQSSQFTVPVNPSEDMVFWRTRYVGPSVP
jgi:hypothetical protein